MSKKKIRNKMPKCTQCSASLNFVGNEEYGDNGYNTSVPLKRDDY